MRICMLVSAKFPPHEGMGVYVWNLSRYLSRLDHQVQIITRSQPGRPYREVVEGITIWRPFFAPLYPFHVHLHSIFVSKLIRKLETELDIFHSHSPLVPPLKTSLPVMLSFHSIIREDVKATKIDSWYTFMMKLQTPVSYQLEIENLKAAASVNAVSPRVAQTLKSYPQCPQHIAIVWNGVDSKVFYPKPEAKSIDNFILTVGRLAPGKGMEDLIDAIASISNSKPGIKLLIVGDGPLRQSLEQRVYAYGLTEKIQFTGQISDRNLLIDFYQKASFFVLPSHHEGLPTVVLEAMACGCPVISTNVGGIPYVIEDGITGILVPPENPERLALAIQSALSDPEQLRDLGTNAHRTIEQRFSWDRIGAQFIELYSGLQQIGKNLR